MNVVCFLFALLGQPPNLPPLITAGFAEQPPVIDGEMSDPCWREAAVVAPFVLLGTADLPTQRTVARVCADTNNVYVGFWCWEDAMDRLQTEAKSRDSGRAWADDCVEVFLAPDGKGEVYYHVIVTAAGAVDDERRWGRGKQSDTTWSFGGSCAQRRASRGWTCEIAIPRYTLGAAAIQGTWLANFARAEQPHSEWSSWPALLTSFHEFERFGRLIWSDTCAVTQFGIGPILAGGNSLTVAMKQKLDVRLFVHRRRRVYSKSLIQTDEGWCFWIDEEGEGYLRVEAWETAGAEDEVSTLAFATPPLHFSLPAISQPLAQASEYLVSAAAELQGRTEPGAQALLMQLRTLRTKHESLRQDIALAKMKVQEGPEEWAKMYQRALDLRWEAFMALAQSRALVRSRSPQLPPFGLGWQSSLVKLRRDDDRVHLTGPIQLSAARDEWESAQLVLLPFEDGVRIQHVHVAPLVNESPTASHPLDSVRVWRVEYVKTRPPAYPVEYVGWWPDPLLPVEPFELTKGHLQPIWISVYVPRSAHAGVYRSQIVVTAEGGFTASWPLEVRVWDITLPRPSTLKTAFSILPRHDVCLWYGFEGFPPQAFRLKLYQLLLEHRINPMSLYSSEMWPPREDIPWCVEHGLNALNIRYVGTDGQGVTDYVRQEAEWLRGHGWLPLAYVYGFDEVRPDEYDELKTAFSAVRKAVPELRRACTVAPNEALEGTVDIWVPLTASFDPRAAEKRRKAGDEVWWYICAGPWHPYCNWFIDYPATDARVLFWQTFKYGVTGFLYYEIAMWRTNLITQPSADGTQIPPEEEEVRRAIEQGKRWPDIPWNTFTFGHYNGDGLLIYPGKQQTPLPSVRLEVIRDGIEDYDLLSVLRDARAAIMKSHQTEGKQELVAIATELLGIRPHIARDLTHYTTTPLDILREREAVARTILRLRQAMAPSQETPASARPGGQ